MSYISRAPRRPRADYDDWCDQVASHLQITVHEDEQEPQWTGLYDAQGNELWSVADKLPMGFRAK